MKNQQQLWTEYLTKRASEEDVALALTTAELYGWCAGVAGDDDPEGVWAAFLETLAAKPGLPIS